MTGGVNVKPRDLSEDFFSKGWECLFRSFFKPFLRDTRPSSLYGNGRVYGASFCGYDPLQQMKVRGGGVEWVPSPGGCDWTATREIHDGRRHPTRFRNYDGNNGDWVTVSVPWVALAREHERKSKIRVAMGM